MGLKLIFVQVFLSQHVHAFLHSVGHFGLGLGEVSNFEFELVLKRVFLLFTLKVFADERVLPLFDHHLLGFAVFAEVSLVGLVEALVAFLVGFFLPAVFAIDEIFFLHQLEGAPFEGYPVGVDRAVGF